MTPSDLPDKLPCLTIIPDEIPSPYKSHIPCRLSPSPITKFTQHSNSRCRNTMREHLIRVYIKPKNTNPDFCIQLSHSKTHDDGLQKNSSCFTNLKSLNRRGCSPRQGSKPSIMSQRIWVTKTFHNEPKNITH